MKKLLYALVLVVLLCPRAFGGTNYDVRFTTLDADGDRTMSKAEFIIAFPDVDLKRFETIDGNGDGAVNLSEWETYRKAVCRR